MTFRRKVLAGVVLAGAALVLVAIFTYRSTRDNAKDRMWVNHTHVVLETMEALETSALEAAANQRTFLLTGEDSYVAEYQTALVTLRNKLHELRSLTSDNPRQQAALDSFEPLIDRKIANLDSQIRSRERDGLQSAVPLVQQGGARQLTEDIRTSLTNMKAEEHRLLALRDVELEASSRRLRLLIIGANALAFGLFFLAGLAIYREMEQRSRVEAEVRLLNAELEKRVEERTRQLAERAKDLETSNQELQQFAYVASHDLQEPLRTISSFTQLLAKRYQDKLDDNAREFIHFAVDGCKRMQTLINDLLAFSRVGTQGKPLDPVDCDAVLNRVLRTLKIAIEESRVAITRDPLPKVLADEIQLSQLLQNLIGNAIKFRGKDTPRVHISATQEGALWKISVQDNGIGIAPEHNERIFVIFQRLHTKMQYPGTGIGLAICKKIAERHGGRIWVEPTPGGGSTFVFTIQNAKSTSHKEKYTHEFRLAATTD
jgi:signal transduction histidine kinase